MDNIVSIHFGVGYGGFTVKITARTETGKEFPIDPTYLEKYLLETIDARGYKTTAEGRQKLERLTIND